MSTVKSIELLDSVMSGQQVEPRQIDDLVANQVREDLYLDYKHGNELKKENHPASTIRRYVSGFANSDGGIVIVGIDATQWNVTGCSAPGGGDLAEWASRCLTPIAPHLSPPPRIQVVSHTNGNVLIIATYRSHSLVPVVESGRLVHYLRLGEQTLTAPDYLISDLVLGRHQKPQLELTKVYLQVTDPPTQAPKETIRFTLSFDVINEGLYWAENVGIGLVYWNMSRCDEKIPQQVLSNVNTLQPINTYSQFYLVHSVSALEQEKTINIPAFVSERVYIREAITLPFNPDRVGLYTWKAAAYILGKNAAPTWYQLEITLMQPSELLGPMPNDNIVAFEPTLNERPTVSFAGL